jgi:gliding motility-associated-like protein
MQKLISIIFLFLSINCFSQFSKTHYIPPLSNSPSQAPQGQYMYISSPSLTPINFIIKQMGGSNIAGTVSRDAPYTLNIGSGFNTQLLISDEPGNSLVNTILSNKGYIIEAEDLIYVTVRLTSTPDNYQAGGLVSKGLAALGNRFRIGAFINTGAPASTDSHYTFATILATENNTTISFDDIKPNVELINNAAAGSTPSSIVLNSGQSYAIAVKGPLDANRDGLIGALIKSDKPIVVNCGSFAGSDGDTGNLDLGFDQIVSAERTGTEYIFVKGIGPNNVERPLIIGDYEDPLNPLAGTDVFLNGSTTPTINLKHGEYLAIDGSQYSPLGNLYVRTSHNVFAFQGIGGTTAIPNTTTTGQPNQNMCFVPPLSCQTPKVINNIPLISKVGNLDFPATICLVTKLGAVLNFIKDGQPYTVANLSSQSTGPDPVVGNPDYVTYTFKNLTGNVSVFSDKQVYLSYYGTSGAATYGGFYSGFTFKPEIAFGKVNTAATNCYPNVKLSVNTLSSFDDFKWYFNNSPTPIAGATFNEYIPQQPGFYKVTAKITECGISLDSDQIPVSACPSDYDNDGVNDNFDLDIDGDAISNCQESYGNVNLDLSSTSATPTGIQIGTYTNSFTKSNIGSGTQTAAPFSGTVDGNFTTSTAVGKGNSTTETFNFPITKPISLSLEYADVVATSADLISSDGDFKVEVPVDKTITVLNPNDQILIDTNYDGNYESGVTNFSSFQIRFRLKSGTPLPVGTGTFKFVASLVNKLSITHTNLSDQNSNKASFKLIATCVPKDTDGDGVPDQLDADSDNDAIPDNIEAMGVNYTVQPFVDANNNGLNDANEPITTPKDSDSDGVFDYVDLDSDNDGIFDLVESGQTVSDVNNNGIIDGNPATFGSNGIANSLETTPDSGIMITPVSNLDGDGFPDYLDLDTDNDTCLDVTEAGFLDQDVDGMLGKTPILVNTNGIVTSATNGYTAPNSNYNTNGLITIYTQPLPQTSCATENASFTIATNSVNGYQWQESSDGINYYNINNGGIYGGTNSVTLTLTGVTNAMNGYKYRVFLTKNGNTCGKNSDGDVLTVLVQPTPIATTLVQCEDDLNGLADFNLTQKEPLISNNSANEAFTYFSTENAAKTNDLNFKISNPTVYNNSNGNTVWVRVVNNTSHCYNTARLDLIVSSTQIPAGTTWNYYKCDDYIDAVNDDRDGIAKFDFSDVTTKINQILPTTSSYVIKYYKNQADADAETDAIGNSLEISQVLTDPINISNYRNITPNQQFIWVRIDGTVNNSCYGLGPYINLTVEALPIANPVNLGVFCDDNPRDNVVNHSFDTSAIESTILGGQSLSNVKIEYTTANNVVYTQLPNPFLSDTQTINIKLTNKLTNDPNGPCYDETTLELKVDKKAFGDPVYVPEQCDEDATDNIATYSFDTASIQNDLVGAQTGFDIKYFAQDGTALSSPLPNPFKTATQRIKVVVENPLNSICNTETFIQFTVNPLPDIKLFDDEIICNGKINNSVKLNAGLQSGVSSDYTYVWLKNGLVLNGSVDYYYTVTDDGVYTTVVKNFNTGCERIRTNTVTFSEKATITDVIIVDLTDNATVDIKQSGNGTYEYSIDEPEGPFQSLSFFQNVTPGIHTVYVHDINRCGTAEKMIAVLGAPKFFTPNGDGINDTWKVLGVNSVFYKNSRMFIFDRFGKVLKEVTGRNDEGWDGNYNGQPLPSDDYWFVLNVDDGRTAKGHFALKR